MNNFFDPNQNYNWKKFKSISDIRNIYKIEQNMLYKNLKDETFKKAVNQGLLIFDNNGTLIAVHSLETVGRTNPQTVKLNQYLVIGSSFDCYPIDKNIFDERYIHIKNSQYQKKSNIIIYAIKNPTNQNIFVHHESGNLICKPNDYIVKNNNSYSVIDQDVFNKTYVQD